MPNPTFPLPDQPSDGGPQDQAHPTMPVSDAPYPTMPDPGTSYPNMPDPATPTARRTGGTGGMPRWLLPAVAVVCAAALIGGVAIWSFNRSSDAGSANTAGSGGGDSYVTACGSPPTFTPQSYRTDSGGLVATMKVTATCPDGDVLSGPQTAISLRDGSSLVASGMFDFSVAPLGIPSGGSDADGVTIDLTFPAGSFYRLPDTLGGSASGGRQIVVECNKGQAGPARVPASSGTAPGVTAMGAAVPMGVDTSASAGDALRAQADSDRSFILSNLNNRWVAQLSSKRPGLVADGRTWDNQAILDEFLASRLRFSDVRLLWSNEWSVFSYQGWWVTVAADTFPGPDAAIAWCRTQGFDPDHCFAKMISTSAAPDQSTRYWN